MQRLFVPVLVAVSVCAQTAPKRPLTHGDYDGWKTIQKATVSRDGRYLAYGLFPQEGDGHLVVRDLQTGEERREAAGALPPPPETPGDREPGEPPPETGIRIAFTADGRFVVFSTFPSKADVDKAKKDKSDAPKGGLGILDLQAKAEAHRVQNVKSFRVPGKSGPFVAYLKEGIKPGKEAESKPDKSVEFGTDLTLRDLIQGTDRTFADVLEYTLSRDGQSLMYATSSRTPETNGVYAVRTAAAAEPQPLLQGKGKHQKLTWNLQQTQLAFLSDRDDAESKKAQPKLYVWEAGGEPAREIAAPGSKGLPEGWTISDKGRVSFTRNGRRILFGTRPAQPEQAEAAAAEVAVADLWHYRDAHVQPMQKVRAARERNRSYTAAHDLDSGTVTQIGSQKIPTVVPSDDGRFAIGFDDRAYRPLGDYDRIYADYYLIDVAGGGSSKKLVEKGETTYGAHLSWSPDSKHALIYRPPDWYALDAATGAIKNITKDLPVKFAREDDDRPTDPPAYGAAGWTRDSRWILLYDRYDIWQISADGAVKRNLTDGVGRKQQFEFRVVRSDEDEDAPRGIDASKPLLLRAEQAHSHETGFWRDRVDASQPPQKLVMDARNYRPVTKAKDAPLFVFTASTFEEFPDLHVSDLDFRASRKVSDANPQKADFLWGSSELISFRNIDGVPLQAVLYKPEGFDPEKRYPLLVYIYERLSQTVHNFVDPRPATSPNIAFYVSNGYLVLTPDIVYTTGAPGQSALKCVLPAIDAAIARGGVDENAIGIAGHSWGGYQVSYMVTQTKRFKAAEAGAPVGNMTSAYNGIRWGSGMPRQFQYERTQSRIGGSLWEYPLEFLANSPVFHIRKVETPLLVLHNDQDDAVPWYQGIELFMSLRRNGKEAYMFNYNGEKHGLRKRINQKDWTVRMQQFFDHHLKGAPKPEWMARGIPYIEREQEKRSSPAATDR